MNAPLGGSFEVLQHMKCRVHVSLGSIVEVTGQKEGDRSDVGAGAGAEPVESANQGLELLDESGFRLWVQAVMFD